MLVIEFEVPDAQGKMHSYKVKPTPAEEGLGISMRLMGMVSAPSLSALGAILAPVLSQSRLGASAADLLDDPELLGNTAQALQGADLTATGAAVGALLQDAKNVHFMRNTILRSVHRDGESLADSVAFNAAFTQNYGELYSVLWEVIARNGFFAWPSTWTTALKKLTEASPEEAAPSATPESSG